MRRARPNPSSAGASLVRFSTSAFSCAPSARIGVLPWCEPQSSVPANVM